MTDYKQKAKDFLDKCNAKMRITFASKEINHAWNETVPRNKYHFTITTPLGKMDGYFWDSIRNTELTSTSYKQFYETAMRKCHDGVLPKDFPEPGQYFKMQQEARPSVYDILACLEKHDVGTIDDFVSEFGYEVRKWSDVRRIEDIYHATVKEYHDLCRIFTPEQMEMLREIN